MTTANSSTYSGLGMGQAIRSVFGKYATFNGRATRSEYWWWALFSALISFVTGAIAIAGAVWLTAGAAANGGTVESADLAGGLTMLIVGLVLAGGWGLAVIIPSLAVSIRRFHDAGYSGWFWLFNFIPSVGNIVVLVFMLLPSQPEANQWGAAPTPKV